MMYKAKINNFCNGKHFIAGELYSKEDVKGLDPNDFEIVGKKKATAKPKPKTKKGKK